MLEYVLRPGKPEAFSGGAQALYQLVMPLCDTREAMTGTAALSPKGGEGCERSEQAAGAFSSRRELGLRPPKGSCPQAGEGVLPRFSRQGMILVRASVGPVFAWGELGCSRNSQICRPEGPLY
jgi:hypothetical protein